MDLEQLVAALEQKNARQKAEISDLTAKVADLEKKSLTPEQVARLQALLA